MNKYYKPTTDEYVTIWDGRRDAPHGGYLAHIPEPIRPAPPLVKARGLGYERKYANLESAERRGHFASELPSLDEIQRTEEP